MQCTTGAGRRLHHCLPWPAGCACGQCQEAETRVPRTYGGTRGLSPHSGAGLHPIDGRPGDLAVLMNRDVSRRPRRQHARRPAESPPPSKSAQKPPLRRAVATSLAACVSPRLVSGRLQSTSPPRLNSRCRLELIAGLWTWRPSICSSYKLAAIPCPGRREHGRACMPVETFGAIPG